MGAPVSIHKESQGISTKYDSNDRKTKGFLLISFTHHSLEFSIQL